MQFAAVSVILYSEQAIKRGMIMDTFYDKMKFIRLCFHIMDAVPALGSSVLNYVDVTYVLFGEMSYYINGTAVTVKAGSAIVFPQGSTRQRLAGNEPTYYVSFNVQVPEDFNLGVSGLVKNAVCPNTVYMLENAKKDDLSIDPEKTNKVLSTFIYLCCQLREIAIGSGNPHVKLIKQYIYDHLCEDITLAALSDHVHLVEQYICSIFKKHTGMTVFQYINSERIDLAKRLIATNEFTLIKISEMCGFSDYNYFSRIFRQIVGMTPVYYRRSALDLTAKRSPKNQSDE